MLVKSTVYVASFLLLSPAILCVVEPNTVIATINVGVTPAGLAITPDNRFAYVANNNNYSLAGGDTVSVLNLTNNTLAQTISDASFNEPYTVTINAAGTKAYVTNSNSTTITIIDIASNTVTGTIGGFDGPSGMVITPGGTFAYVNNYGGPGGVGSGNGTTVRVVNLNTNLIVGAPITVGQAPAALAITPDGSFVYVINYVDGNTGTGTISIIRTSDNTVVGTITGFSGPFAIAITPDGTRAYVTNFGSNNFAPIGTTVSVVDLNSNTIIATINLAIQPSGIAITPDGRLAYATNYNTLYAGPGFTNLTAGQGTVNIIDTATNTVIPPIIAVDQSPDAVAISSNGEYAYVSNYTSNTVSVIALQSFQISAQGCRIQNRYLTQIDLVNKLTWTVSGASLPVNYLIYRDAELTDLAGTVLATESFVFLDHNRQPNITYTYYIVGINGVGIASDPVAVTVTQNC
ncbi:MAG: YncE family protein [Candidatus Babeliaceae bacterium]|jgi:YVTN family beta-propeller protein